MPLMDLGGLLLWYESIQGPDADPSAIPVVMIQGLGMQATEWPATLIRQLSIARRVIIFDNRDAGLSQLFGPAVDPSLTSDRFPTSAPLDATPPYVLADMAKDVLRLLNALQISTAHVIGFSMGGMIGQILAARSAARIASLVGLMTSSGQAWLESTKAADDMLRHSILAEPDQDRLIKATMEAEQVYAGRSPLPDIATRRSSVLHSIGRAYCPAGIWRQAIAMRAAGERSAMLRTIQCPILMLHGEDDPVISPAQAATMSSLASQTQFEIMAGTGHILTEQNAVRILSYIKKFW